MPSPRAHCSERAGHFKRNCRDAGQFVYPVCAAFRALHSGDGATPGGLPGYSRIIRAKNSTLGSHSERRISWTRFWADDGQPFLNSVKEGLPTIQDFASVAVSLDSAYTSHATLWVREQR